MFIALFWMVVLRITNGVGGDLNSVSALVVSFIERDKVRISLAGAN